MKNTQRLCVWALLFALLLPLWGCAAEEALSPEVSQGVAYLESLERKDPAVLDAVLEQRRKDELERERDEIMEQLTSGDRDVWSMFHDYVILGDSRAVGFWYYDFLDKERVLADGGHTIRNIEPYLADIQALDPSYVFLCYGLNDVSIGYWDTPEEYAEEMVERVKMLNEAVPDALVVVSSILPAFDPAFETASVWRKIPDFSAAVEEACEENGIVFVNNDKLAESYPELWDPDGIHLRREFYDHWAKNLIFAILQEDANE